MTPIIWMEACLLLVMKFAACFSLLTLIAPAYAQSVGGFGGGSAGYDGPAILGRSGGRAGMEGAEAHPIRVFASVDGTYDSNLVGSTVDANGNFSPKPSYGVNLGFGARGRKIWRRKYLGIDYRGDYGQYRPQSLYNGTNQELNVESGLQLGAKLQIQTQLAAGTSNRFLGGQTIFQSSELEFLTAPTQELFNSRSYFLGNNTGAVYSFNRRKSVRVSGYANSVKRVARALIDMQSYGATADYVQRINRSVSAGVSYTFVHYDYKKVFGDSEVHTIGGHLSKKIGRDLDLSGSLTATKQSTVGVRTVSLDPVIAAILGRSVGAEVFESNNLLYGYTVSIMRRIRNSTAQAMAQRGVTPGNGYFLTSINEFVSASVDHRITRNLSISGSFGYNKLISLGFTSGNFNGWSGGGGANYKVSETVGLNANYQWRSYRLQNSQFQRAGHRVTIGISYHPQGGPAGLF